MGGGGTCGANPPARLICDWSVAAFMYGLTDIG